MENDKCTVCVLMSTYNGEKYLEEQIDSILAQKGCKVQLLVRDDGSSDGTIGILQKYHEEGYLEYYTGENLKPAKSFMDLLYNAPKAEYYASVSYTHLDVYKRQAVSGADGSGSNPGSLF